MSATQSERRQAGLEWPSRWMNRRHMIGAMVGGGTGAVLTSGALRAAAQTPPSATPSAETLTYVIPGERVFPEGVAYDPVTHVFYVGSSEDGTIFRGNLTTGIIERFLPGGEDERTAVTGLRVDEAGRLVVCGRRTGRIFVYDTSNGALLSRRWNGRAEGTLINDVAITADGVAYVTDSFAPVLYRLDLAALPEGRGSTPVAGVAEQELEVFLDFTDTAFAYADGFNANGIVATPDGTALLIVQFNTGRHLRANRHR